MNREAFLRRWCLTTTYFDYRYRSCLKCLRACARNTRLPVTEDPVIVKNGSDGRFELIEDYAWDIERQIFQKLLRRNDLKYIVSILVEFEVSLRQGIYCTYHAYLSETPVHHNNDELISGKQSNAHEVLKFERPTMKLKLYNIEFIPFENERTKAMRDSIRKRIQESLKEVKAQKRRSKKQLKGLGRKNILIDVNARQYGRCMREIDLMTMIDSLIPGCQNIPASQNEMSFL